MSMSVYGYASRCVMQCNRFQLGMLGITQFKWAMYCDARCDTSVVELFECVKLLDHIVPQGIFF